jgi:small subunit ribosomal protein S27e
MKIVVDMPKSKFVKVMCKKCKNEQVIFNKASTIVKCVKCGEVLAEPAGGMVEIKEAKVLRFLS